MSALSHSQKSNSKENRKAMLWRPCFSGHWNVVDSRKNPLTQHKQQLDKHSNRLDRRVCSVQFSHSVVSYSFDPMDCSMPGFPVHHQLPELAQTHVQRVDDVIQPSHPLSSPSPPAFNLSQHQDLFQSVSSSHQVDKVLELQLQHQSFQCIFITDFL